VIHKVVNRLGLASAALLVMKTIPSLVALFGAQQLLSDALAPYLPERVLSTLLTNTCADPEFGCGPQLCSTVSAGCYLLFGVLVVSIKCTCGEAALLPKEPRFLLVACCPLCAQEWNACSMQLSMVSWETMQP
jgi:hypothetical protein